MELNLFYLIGYIMILLGLIGSALPILPGPVLIWFGVFVWAWGDGFQAVNWPLLVLLGLLAVIAWGSDLVLTLVVSRRAGASWRAIGGAIVGGILGGLFLSALPVIGTLFGSIIGAIVGMWLVEYSARNDHQAATQAVFAYVQGVLISTILEIAIALVMVALFAWQVFW
jgi:hypothetical protein